MKKQLNMSLFALLILFSLSRCDKDAGTPGAIEDSPITKVEGPATGIAGQELLIKVSLQGRNGCAVSGELQEAADGNIRTIAGKVNYQGEVCTQALVTIVSNYSFKVSAPGNYELRFLKADKTYLIHSIKVD